MVGVFVPNLVQSININKTRLIIADIILKYLFYTIKVEILDLGFQVTKNTKVKLNKIIKENKVKVFLIKFNLILLLEKAC